MAKKKDVVPVFVDNVEALEAKMQAMREAQKIFATYTQEQVDKIFYAAAVAANKMRIPLAKQAVEETGRGIVEDKVIKNHYAAEYIYNAYKDTKTYAGSLRLAAITRPLYLTICTAGALSSRQEARAYPITPATRAKACKPT